MNIVELEKQIEILTDEINDIFHATELNFDAIKIQLQIDPESENTNEKVSTSAKNTLISQCEKEFKLMKSAYQERSNLRLEYLINEQIKSEEEKVRRERLLEYEDKIYDHRRLICDKESFYDSLIKPKLKRPPGLSNDQFQDYRIKDAQNEERGNFQQLEEETQMLLKLEKVFRNHRILLEEELEKYHKMENKEKNQEEEKSPVVENKELKKQQEQEGVEKNSRPKDKNQNENENEVPLTREKQRELLMKLSESIPVIYSEYDGAYTAPINLETFELGRKLLKDYMGISESEKELMKDYKEEKEMYRYLKWEKNDLIQKYRKLQEEIKNLREKGKVEKKRKLSR